MPGISLHLLVFPRACLFHMGDDPGDSELHWRSVCFVSALVPFLLSALLHFGRLIRAGVGGQGVQTAFVEPFKSLCSAINEGFVWEGVGTID